jgi:hypothetical protein
MSELAKSINWTAIKQVVTDPKLWIMGTLALSSSTVGLGMKFIMPSIVKSMGFTSTKAQLLYVNKAILMNQPAH